MGDPLVMCDNRGMTTDFSAEERKYNLVSQSQFDTLIKAFNEKAKIPKNIVDHEIAEGIQEGWDDFEERGEPELDNPINVVKAVRKQYSGVPNPHEYPRHPEGNVDIDTPNLDVNTYFENHTNSLGIYPDHSMTFVKDLGNDNTIGTHTSLMFDVDGRRKAVDYDIHRFDRSLSEKNIPHVEDESDYFKRLDNLGFKLGEYNFPSAELRDRDLEMKQERLNESLGNSRSGTFHGATQAGRFDPEEDLDSMLKRLKGE